MCVCGGGGGGCKSVLKGRVALGWVGVGFAKVVLKDGWPLVGDWGGVCKYDLTRGVVFGRGTGL